MSKDKSKSKSILLRSPYKQQPINGVAARVMGVGDPNSALNLRIKAKEVRKSLRKTADAKIRQTLQEELDKLIRAIKHGPEPRTDSRAVEKARRQLERAKWVRDNGYK